MKFKYILFVFFFVAICCCINNRDISAKWKIDTIKYHHEFTKWFPSKATAIDSNNTLHLVYGEDNLYYGRSNDGGITWNIEVVDSNFGVGSYTSLVLDQNNYPHISYFDAINNHVKYAGWNGQTWDIVSLDTFKESTGPSSIALNNSGVPYIAYFIKENKLEDMLKYVYFTGNKWEYKEISAVPLNSYSISFVISDSNQILISYTGDEKIYFNKDNGTISKIVDSGKENSLQIDGAGRPVIAYRGMYGNNKSGLFYAYNENDQWFIVPLHFTEEDAGFFPSLAIDSEGYAHISYLSPENKLKYMYQDKTILTVFHSLNINDDGVKFTDLILNENNNPIITYYKDNDHSLKLAVKSGNTWDVNEIDRMEHLGKYLELGINKTIPFLNIYDTFRNDVKLIYLDSTDNLWKTIEVDSTCMSEKIYFKMDTSGISHVIFLDSTELKIKYGEYKNNNWEFSEISTSNKISDLSLSLDSKNNASIAFNNASGLQFTSSPFLNIESVNNSEVGYISLDINKNDNFGIGYSRRDNNEINFSFADKLGGSWQSEVISYSDTTALGINTKFAFDKNGGIHIIYYDIFYSSLVYFRKIDQSWERYISSYYDQLSNDIGFALNNDNVPYISYYEMNKKELVFAYFNDLQSEWIKEAVISNVNADHISLMFDINNIAHLAYYNTFYGNLCYGYKIPNKNPTVELSSDSTGFTDLTISFKLTAEDSDGYIKAYKMNYGDGVSAEYDSNNLMLKHIYKTAGTYTVKVEVIDDENGRATDSTKIKIYPKIIDPKAAKVELKTNLQKGSIPLKITFTIIAAQDTDIKMTKFLWDPEGDNIFETTYIDVAKIYNTTINYTYAKEGNYYPKAKIINSADKISEPHLPVKIEALSKITDSTGNGGGNGCLLMKFPENRKKKIIQMRDEFITGTKISDYFIKYYYQLSPKIMKILID